MATKRHKEGVAASLIVYDIPLMTTRGRMSICKWLRRQANHIERHPGAYGKRYRASYRYVLAK